MNYDNQINPKVEYSVKNGQTIYNINNQASNSTNCQVNNKYKKYWVIGIIIAILIILLALISFFYKGTISRTIMIYMVGADLESKNGLATVELNAINYNEMDNKNINVILIAGGSKNWNNTYIDKNETSIYELTNNGFEKVKSQNLQNMGDSLVLSNFFNYVYDNYKTDEYDLIFWNHGSAILGSEHDEISGDHLSLLDMDAAFSISKFGKNKKLETIAFRTCLNGTLEVASTLKDYADYLIASEEVTRGIASDSVLNFINKIEPSDDGYDYGIKFINSYKNQMASIKALYQQYYGGGYDLYSTYSIVDLSKVDKLENSVNDFFSDININTNYEMIAKVRSNLFQYASDSPDYDMVDLYNLVENLKEISPKKAKTVLDNLENTIVYNWATNDKSRGLSIYFPYNADTQTKTFLLSYYHNFNELKQYDDFITKFNLIQTSSNKNYSFSTNKMNIQSHKDGADFTLELTEEQKKGYAKASYIVFRDNKDGYYLPVYNGNDVILNNNTISANIKNKQLKIVDTNSSSENILTLFETEQTDNYIKYDTVVILENFSSEDISDFVIDVATMSLIYDKVTGKTSIGSISLNDNTKNVPNGMVMVDLNDYTHIAFASSKYKILDEKGNYNENWESNGILEGIETEIEFLDFQRENFEDGYDYYCVFKIFDVDNNYYYSKLIKMN